MNTSAMMTSVVLVAIFGSCIAGVIPAPVIAAPAAIGYAKAVPYNVPPFASRVDISTRALAAPYVAAHVAHPAPAIAAPVVHAAPQVYAGPYGALPAAYGALPVHQGVLPAPIVAAPGFVHSTYAGSLAAPLAHVAAAAHGPAIFA